MSGNITPNYREILNARSTITSQPEHLLSTNHALNVNATVSGTQDTNLTQVDGAAISIGQKTMANSLPVVIASDQTYPQLVPFSYDYTAYTNTSSTIDTYVYKTGGSGGATVATVTINYTDSTKNQVSTVART